MTAPAFCGESPVVEGASGVVSSVDGRRTRVMPVWLRSAEVHGLEARQAWLAFCRLRENYQMKILIRSSPPSSSGSAPGRRAL